MSIRYYADNTFTIKREFSLTEFFDPRLNRIWERAASNKILADDYLKILKGFSSEIINQFPYQLFYNLANYTNHRTLDLFYETFTSKIPSEHTWVLNFCYLESCSLGRANTLTLNFAKFASSVRNESDYSTVEHIDWVSVPTTPDTIASVFASYAAKYEQLFELLRGKVIHNGAFFGPYGKFFKFVKIFTFGQMSYLNTSEGSLNQRNLLNVSPEVSVTTPWTPEQMRSKGIFGDFKVIQTVSKTFRDPLYQVLPYSTNPTHLIQWPIVEKHETSPILYGVELECASNYNVREIIDAQAIPFFIAKQDSSINGHGTTKSELVTVPMSLKAHKKHWAHWFSKIDYSKFDCTKDTNNGMHVHIDRKAFMNETHLKNMTWFYTHPANTDFLVYISERGSLERMQKYSKIISYPTTLSKISAYRSCIDYVRHERGIVNLGKEVTVEIRMFRGIVSFGELCKNLEFVDAVFHFTEGEHNLNRLTFIDFISWLSHQPMNRYTTLRKFIDLCGHINTMITQAEVRNIVFNITDPKKVAEKLNSSKIQITNAHISVLNRGQKRKYTLNKETGQVDVTMNNLSKFHKIDRDIEARYTRQAIA